MSQDVNFAQRIYELRRAAGMTQKQLGDIVGLSMQAVNDIEKGRRDTTLIKLLGIADCFNVSIDYLVGRSDDPTRR